MTEIPDENAFQRDEAEPPVDAGGVEALFAGYSVLSPGVEIVLDGRTVSAPVGD